MSSSRRYLKPDEIDDDLWSTAWLSPKISEQQMDLSQEELRKWAAGQPNKPFDAFGKLIMLCRPFATLMELGCGCGYYSVVISDPRVLYTGLDCSRAMIFEAERAFGSSQCSFGIADAANLTGLADNFQDVVSLSAVIGHMLDWRAAIAEAKRVAKHWLILHRIGVYSDPETPELVSVKTAYGVEMAERFFDRQHLLDTVGLPLKYEIKWPHADKGWMASYLFEVK